ncbi:MULTISPECIES: prepilin-type N-terminal cleavage/methylation domain-containing protein [Psychrilyobacter]|uniref:Prepilin-type N-terminal cleavage/methylation domain-containing protein n=1 Tax=Psychrilyobacter piezotolerans TaxID=2293438 RepID=A0ABX9KEW3_9FUSO|nr:MULTISPECIES: prepilin-type N-terminal cleavage/methylation domain-containing protein [Psychrilyobacter]MCS5421611.1 prepilin-type N-terminal cleavage/methylation domain-containing protein [Psychrilyobacter sp. S5]NDI78183.1 prepilin-type N-terminal cleavage/methylation domain-containing protein [Psychrilyobacter piezotolerans]RDE60125.1 prepilin-type N-terminal cleavage/methylation domain-containing protein [Psychrilyobacter sp. S5]REI40307.1 prepilin-type N-terminal cleavage/methylation do
MRRRGFTLIELLIVVGLIGILVGIGGISIKKQAESRAMLRVQNEVGDFFRVAAKRSQETGKRYAVKFKLDEKFIEISRNGEVTDILKLPNTFEYAKISSGSVDQDFTSNMTSTGNMSGIITLYVFKGNSQSGIQGEEIAKYAIRLLTTDAHVKFLHVKEYVPKSEIKESEIEDGSKDASETAYWKTIKNQ